MNDGEQINPTAKAGREIMEIMAKAAGDKDVCLATLTAQLSVEFLYANMMLLTDEGVSLVIDEAQKRYGKHLASRKEDLESAKKQPTP